MISSYTGWLSAEKCQKRCQVDDLCQYFEFQYKFVQDGYNINYGKCTLIKGKEGLKTWTRGPFSGKPGAANVLNSVTSIFMINNRKRLQDCWHLNCRVKTERAI